MYIFHSDKKPDYIPTLEELKNKKETLVSFEMEKYYQKVKKILIENRRFLDMLAERLGKDRLITYHTVQEIKNECYQN